MNFVESIEYLSSLHAFGWRLDLSRMQALCERLDHPERAFKVVHVAGTNGKGSTTAMISAILARAGYRVGAYFSPYVFNIRERVMLAEPMESPRMIPEDDFARLMTTLKPHADAVAADPALGQPTEFEVKTALAFLFFRERAVDWAVLETGLGGRLDATNVVQPVVSVITNIGLDHTERLGDTLEEIAGEKAGIIKRGAATVTGAVEPALTVILDTHLERGGAEWGVATTDPEQGILADTTVTLREQPGMPGRYQRANALLAKMAALVLRGRGSQIPDEAIASGIETAFLPGRFQVIREHPTVILDGAHNPDGARALAESLRYRFRDKKLIFVVGMMGRHSVEGVVDALAPLAKRIIATQPSEDRALHAQRVAEEATRRGFDAPVVVPPPDALKQALSEAAPDDIIVVTGSFYTVGEIRPDAS